MTKPIIKIHNTETDEVIEREMSDAEYKQYLKDLADFETRQLEATEKAATKKAILDRLGLTADELQTILG